MCHLDANVPQNSTLFLVLRLRGGGGPPAVMGLAAGGLIKQSILRDGNSPKIWDDANTTIFNVSILNSLSFKSLTGQDPPKCPITASTYAAEGFPYFDIYNEKPSGIRGAFDGLRTVNELDKTGYQSIVKQRAAAEAGKDHNARVVTLDSNGLSVGFRTVTALEREVKEWSDEMRS